MGKKQNKLVVQNIEISLTSIRNEDYICLTDMIKAKDGDFFISDWLRNANTLEYLGAWEALNNPNFNYGEFAAIRAKAGVNSYKISVKEWMSKTGAIGITAKTGRYGGTYAHKDIAFNFGMWISPVFQLYIVQEYQRLKRIEANQYGLEWDVKRILSKANYKVHTDAVKNYIIPQRQCPTDKESIIYADEADLLNVALFGCTAKQWREANPDRAANGENIRDVASINELTILSNIESLNSALIAKNIDRQTRCMMLKEVVQEQKTTLDKIDILKKIKKEYPAVYVEAEETQKKKEIETKKTNKRFWQR